MKNIVFFNLAVMPYHVAVFKALIEKGFNCIVYWYGTKPKTKFRAPDIKGLTLYNRFDFDSPQALFDHSKQFNPLLVVCCGWVDKGYNTACSFYRKISITTIASSDTQWHGGRQWLNRLLSPFRHKRYFDYIWAAGILQFDYARKLGYKQNRILLNCFSGDTHSFSKVSIEQKIKAYPKRFLFVGRFVNVKAIDILLSAWDTIEDKHGWQLELVGDGPLKEKFKNEHKDVIIKDFMDQESLAKEAQESGCFIIPSRFEPWALVIHEFAAAGLPIISSDRCGASRHFVLNGYNGYVVTADDIEALRLAIGKIINSTDAELVRFSVNSRQLAMQCTPEFVADTLISLL